MIIDKKRSILIALGQYKFLNRIQMARLGIEKYNSAFSKHIPPLIEAKYIGLLDATYYSLGHIYYLTKKGAHYLRNILDFCLDDLHYCVKKPILSTQTLFHRTNAINCQIELFLTCNFENFSVEFYEREIEALGSIRGATKLARKTRLTVSKDCVLEPDAIFMLNTEVGQKLFCLEYEHKDTTKKSIAKAKKHVMALNARTPSEKYSHSKAHRVLFVYYNPSIMISVMNYLNQNIKGLESWFLFKNYRDVISVDSFKKSKYCLERKKSFLESWQQCNGERVSLY